MPSAEAIRPEISTLDNGLRIVTTSIPTAQSASTAFFVRVGSRGEDRRNNGVSHYLEHMLFKGTERRPTAPEISQAIEGAGGALNAYTSRELTCYWNTLPFERAETGIEVVADMLQHSLLPAEEIDRERTVVQQEIRRGHDTPAARAGELMVEAVYGDQPIGWPVTGTLETVGALQREDFTTHVERFYTSSNSVLSVAGNVRARLGRRDRGAPLRGPARGRPCDGSRRRARPARAARDRRGARDRADEPCARRAGDLAPRPRPLRARAAPHRPRPAGCPRGCSRRCASGAGLAYSVGSRIARHRDIGMFSVSAGVTADQPGRGAGGDPRLSSTAPPASQCSDEELRRALDFATGTFRLSLETPMALGQRFGEQLLQDGELEVAHRHRGAHASRDRRRHAGGRTTRLRRPRVRARGRRSVGVRRAARRAAGGLSEHAHDARTLARNLILLPGIRVGATRADAVTAGVEHIAEAVATGAEVHVRVANPRVERLREDLEAVAGAECAAVLLAETLIPQDLRDADVERAAP